MSDEKRKPGRPKADEPGAALSTWIRQSDADRLIRRALKEDKTVSALVRELLTLKIRRD